VSIYDYEAAFGQADSTTKAMRKAVQRWFSLYYDQIASEESNPCQRVAYTVVNKLIKTAFGEYRATAGDSFTQDIIRQLDGYAKQAVQLALVGGECYIKPYPVEGGFDFTLIPRDRMLIFSRDHRGIPTDVGTVERRTWQNYYYTLLERRSVDGQGYLHIQNKLYKAANPENLGNEVSLRSCPFYEDLVESYRYEQPVGSTGLVQLRTPMLNCVDGSADGVSVYAAAADLIENIDENEAQLRGEFQRGKSRIIASRDLLRDGVALEDTLFVGLDDDPEQVGITAFSPKLRTEDYLARKQEYLRNAESIIGLKRGMLSDANVEERTATEIASSAGDYNLTVIDFQQMWQKALQETAQLCATISTLYGKHVKAGIISIDWGNGILYDEEATWESYMGMVQAGILKPEIALAWRFDLPYKTAEQIAAIREEYMPN
jgi:A118 family predicted phage portal protein